MVGVGVRVNVAVGASVDVDVSVGAGVSVGRNVAVAVSLGKAVDVGAISCGIVQDVSRVKIKIRKICFNMAELYSRGGSKTRPYIYVKEVTKRYYPKITYCCKKSTTSL
jgi:hypothetical protein